MVEFDFDPAWFGDIKANTLENHRKRLEVLYENLPGIDLANDMDRVVEFVEARYDAPFNVYATLRKVLRATAPTSKGMQILLKRLRRSTAREESFWGERNRRSRRSCGWSGRSSSGHRGPLQEGEA